MEEAPRGQVITVLRLRDRELTLTSTGSGVRYSVRHSSGQVQPNLTLEELQAYDPDLYASAGEALVGGAPQGRPSYLDARLDLLANQPLSE